MARPQPSDRLSSRKKATITKVTFSLDTEISDEFDEARRAHEIAQDRLKLAPERADLQAEADQAKSAYDKAKKLMDKNVIIFKVKSLGRRRFEELMLRHPATPDQQEEEKKRTGLPLQWNPDTFPPALLAASIIEPEMDAAEIKEMWESDDWTSAELNELLETCLIVNQQRRIVNLGKG